MTPEQLIEAKICKGAFHQNHPVYDLDFGDVRDLMEQYADQQNAALKLQVQNLLDTIERDYVQKSQVLTNEQVEELERKAFEAGQQTLYRSDRKTIDELFKEWKEETK